MRIVVRRVQEVDVVRRDDSDAEFLAEFNHPGHDPRLPRIEFVKLLNRLAGNRGLLVAALALPRRMQHHLERIVIAEQVLIPPRHALRFVHPPDVNRVGDLAGDARRRAVQPLVILLEEGMVDSGVVIEAVDVRERDEAHEIVVARQILRVKAKVIAAFRLVACRVVARRRYVSLHAENRLHPLLAAFVVKRLQREQVAVVGHRQRGHPQFLRLCDQRLDLTLPVKQ